jgi:hypothetical protein
MSDGKNPESSTDTLLIAVPGEDFAGICETFCDDCGQLRLWVRREYPKSCGACGAPDPLVGGVGSRVLTMAKAQWVQPECAMCGVKLSDGNLCKACHDA